MGSWSSFSFGRYSLVKILAFPSLPNRMTFFSKEEIPMTVSGWEVAEAYTSKVILK